MQDDPLQTVRRLSALAGVPLSEERIAALALLLPLAQNAAATLAAVDYGEIEPAPHFRPRPRRAVGREGPR